MAALFLYFLVFVALYIISKRFLNRIQNLPPSPFPCLPIVGHLHLLKQPIYRTLAKISLRNGPIFLLQLGSRRVVVVSSPSLAEECFTKNDVVFANRPSLLIGKHLAYNYTILSWAPYGDHWRNLRRIVSLEILSIHRLQMLSGIRLDEVRSLISRLFRNQNQTVEMGTALYELTLNVMMRMIAGKRYYGEKVSDMEEAKKFRAIQVETIKVIGATNIGDYLPWMSSKDVVKKMIACHRRRDEFMQRLIEEQRKEMKIECSGEKKKKTLIQVLLSLQQTQPDYYTDDIMKGLILVLLSAGTDTSINTMEWALSLLLNNPQVLKNAQIEIEKNVGHDRLIEETDLSQLPYLRSIINETLRMYPPVPLLLPHESSEQCFLGGFCIPRDTILLVNVWSIQNDPNNWEDPREFKPERFINGIEGEKDVFRLMPFGYGRRRCPGEVLGLRVIGLTLASLIQCFEWGRIGDSPVDMTEGIGVTMPRVQPLKVVCKPRPTMLNLISHI